MTIFWFVLIDVLVMITLIFMYVFFTLRKVGQPTSGQQIKKEERPGTALLVIDAQEDFLRNEGAGKINPVERDAALQKIKARIEQARGEGEEVIFICNVFKAWPVRLAMKLMAGGVGNQGRPGLRIDPEIDVKDEKVFTKSIGDAFSVEALENHLKDKGIGCLRLVGLDACHCVQLTAKGALQRGYDVEVIEAATMSSTPGKWPAFRQQIESLGGTFK